MNPLERLLARWFGRGLLVDSNLLLLFFTGSVRLELISIFERTRGYDIQEFEALTAIIRSFTTHGRLLTTPPVLAEVSNLATKLKGPDRWLFFDQLARWAVVVDERYIPSTAFIESDRLSELGYCDLCILELSREPCLVLTGDERLAAQLRTQGAEVLSWSLVRATMSE